MQIIGWVPVYVGVQPVWTAYGWRWMNLWQWQPVWGQA